MDQLAVEVTSYASAFQSDFDIVPSVCLNRTGHVLSDAALIEFNGVLSVPPAADIPPISLLAFSGKANQESLRPAKFSRFKRQCVVTPIVIAEKAQPRRAIALAISPIHNGPASAI